MRFIILHSYKQLLSEYKVVAYLLALGRCSLSPFVPQEGSDCVACCCFDDLWLANNTFHSPLLWKAKSSSMIYTISLSIAFGSVWALPDKSVKITHTRDPWKSYQIRPVTLFRILDQDPLGYRVFGYRWIRKDLYSSTCQPVPDLYPIHLHIKTVVFMP